MRDAQVAHDGLGSLQASKGSPDGAGLAFLDLVVNEATRSMGDFLEVQFGNGTAPDGSRIIIPTWVTWQSAKAEVASAAGVLDDDVMDALLAQSAADEGPAKELALARYDAELDRVIGENHLEDAVRWVHSAFFSTDPDA